MRLGLNFAPPHTSPEEWAEILVSMGAKAASFPVDHTAPVSLIDQYVRVAKENDILIAEVGIWDSAFLTDPVKAEAAKEKSLEKFRLADYIGARCCVNVSGGVGEKWFSCYADNYTQETYERNVEWIRYLCDTVQPKNTYYALEPMPWMIPDGPDIYLKLLKDVDRERFGVHMDFVNFIKDGYTFTHRDQLMDEVYEKLSPYIRSCHLKDLRMGPGATVVLEEVAIGTGHVDMKKHLEILKSLDPEMPVLLEHWPTTEDFRREMKTVQGLLG